MSLTNAPGGMGGIMPSSCRPSLSHQGHSGRFYMRTLFLASSGSTLGHEPTTGTHAFRRPPKRERGTHTQYTLFDECIAPGPTQWLRPSRRSLTGFGFGVARSVRIEPPHPTFSSVVEAWKACREHGAAAGVRWREAQSRWVWWCVGPQVVVRSG